MSSSWPGWRGGVLFPSLRNKGAVAFIEIIRRADARDLKRLSPGSCRKIFCGFDCLGFRFQSGIYINHGFGQNSAIQLLWRRDFKDAQNRWRKINIAARQIVHLAMTKIRTGCDQGVVHVESAEGSVRPLPCSSLPIRVNHSRDSELIL